MKNNQSIGEIYRLQNGLSNDEHELFHEYLLISPSYQLAHKVMSGQAVDTAVIDGVSKWDSVLETYAVCGDVFSMPFLRWWETIGRGVFYTQKEDSTYTIKGSLRLLSNKVRIKTLMEGVALVNDKARLEIKKGKRIENWRLGVEVSLRSKWTKQLKSSTKKTHDNLEARTTMGILVSKKIKEALYIAENAARGSFPSTTPIDSGLEFNYYALYYLVKANLIKDLSERLARKRNGLYIPKTYFARKVKPKLDKAKKIQIEVERQIKLRAGKA
jgi:hypothetical protein